MNCLLHVDRRWVCDGRNVQLRTGLQGAKGWWGWQPHSGGHQLQFTDSLQKEKDQQKQKNNFKIFFGSLKWIKLCKN